MKHKHYDLIVAKAANMDLVVFSKRSDSNRWVELEIHKQCVSFNETHSYFLCLPQHKEACLHWLNGGESQYLSNGMGKWIDFGDSKSWSITHLFMTDECELRIKPKKEKRWMSIRRIDLLVDDKPYNTREEAEAANSPAHWNHYELLIEV